MCGEVKGSIMDNLSLRCWLFEDLLVMGSQTWTDGLSGGNQARDKGKLALGWEGCSEGHYHLIGDRGFAQCPC